MELELARQGELAREKRGPAFVTAAIFLAYAVAKAVYASQGKLGLPSGPVVPAEDYVPYADEVMGVSATQWLASATGVAGAALMLVAVSRVGRWLPQGLMLAALGVAFVGFGAGAAVMVADGFVGIGVGWQWYHGVLGLFTLVVFAMAIRAYARSTRTAIRPAPRWVQRISSEHE